MIATKHDPANGITGYKALHINPNITESGVYEITLNGVEGFTSYLTRISDISGNPDGTTPKREFNIDDITMIYRKYTVK